MPTITQKFGFDARGASRSLTNITNKMKDATQALRDLKAEGGANILGGVNKSTDDAKKKTESLTVSWQTMVRVITTQIIVRSLNSVINEMVEAIERARELGLAVAEIKNISGGALGLDTTNLQDDLVALSNRITESVGEVAEGVYRTLSNQVVDATHALEFYEKAANLAVVTNAKSSEVVNALSSVMNSYALSVEHTDEVMDTLFKTIELGRIRMSELGDAVGRVLPLASQMGVSYQEAAAALAVMTRQGVKTSTAVTQLQAVLQKLLRPSEAMQAIYEKWGVQSGPQAINAFGGLRGVLAKLQQETDFNAAAQGELFLRVRAVTSAMALGVDEGKEFADTYDQISDAAGAAKNAIEEFQQSEAFKLTLAQQELSNQWTELGTKLIPLANYGLKLLNNDMKAAGLLWGAVTGKFDESYHALKRIQEQQDALNKQADDYAKNLKIPEIDQLDTLGKDTAEYYAEVNKYEQRLRQVREDSIKAAGKALAYSHKNIVDAYKDGIKELEKFIDQARDIWRKAADEIADVQREADDAALDNRLENAQTAGEKQRIIDAAVAEQRRKAEEAIRQVGADPESKERALAEQERLQSLIESAKSISEEAGNRGRLLDYQRQEIDAIKRKEEIIKRNRDATLNVVSAVDEVKQSWEEAAQKLDELFTQREGLLEKLAGLDLTKNTDKQAADRVGSELKELDKQIEGVFAAGRYGAQFLKSLGIDTAFEDVSKGFQAALDKATFDWAREVDRAQAAFDQKIIRIKAAIDPVGRGQQAADAFGLEQGTDEDYMTFMLRTQEAVQAGFEQWAEAIKAVQGDLAKVASGESQVLDITQSIEASARRQASITIGRLESAKSGFDGGGPGIDKMIADRTAQLEKQNALWAEQLGKVREMASEINNGKVYTEEQVQSLREQTLEVSKKMMLSKSDNQSLQVALDLLEEMRQRRERANQAAEQIPEREQLEAGRRFIEQLDFQIQKQEVNKDAAEKARQAVEEGKIQMQQSAGAAGQVGQGLQNAGQGATTMSQGTVSTAQVLPGTVGLANSLALAFSKAANEAERMAAAAAAGGGAVAFHGGPMNKWFASGGMLSRGQDKILTALTAGETVVNAKNSRKFFSELNAMNQGSKPVYREQGGAVTNVGDINVSVNGGDSSQQTVREIAHALRREAQRGNIKLR